MNIKWKLIRQTNSGKHPKGLYRCICGKVKEVDMYSVRKGKSRSCGCYYKTGNTQHGMHGTRFHRIWVGMRTRVRTPQRKTYSKISVCDEWQDFKKFKSDMYQSYQEHVKLHGRKNTSLDRIDNKLGYSKDNCRWATPKQQAVNRNNTIFLENNGESLTLSEWSERVNIKVPTLYRRYKEGWSVKKILTTAVTPNGK